MYCTYMYMHVYIHVIVVSMTMGWYQVSSVNTDNVLPQKDVQEAESLSPVEDRPGLLHTGTSPETCQMVASIVALMSCDPPILGGFL